MLTVAPLSLKEANAYVEAFHRHNGRLPSHKFSMACIEAETGQVHGVAIAGLPKARMLMDGWTIEINRVCTDGIFNACSLLYGACVRTAKGMGYRRIVTYTLESEPGASLKASGFKRVGAAGGGSWARDGRPVVADDHDLGTKVRWEVSSPYPAKLVPPL